MEYQGRFLGNVHVGMKDSQGHYKFNLAMEDMAALETLLRLSPSDEILVDGKPESYEQFRREVLEKTDAIYSSLEAYVSSEFPFPYGRRVPDETLKGLESQAKDLPEDKTSQPPYGCGFSR